MWPKIEFETGEPVTLHLCYPQGKVVSSRFYERWPGDVVHYLFNCEEGVFFLPDSAGALLNARLRSIGYAAGEPLTITRLQVPNPNSERRITEYIPYRCVEVE